MASNLVSKIFRPPVFTKLVSCCRILFCFVLFLLLYLTHVTLLSSGQASLRSGCVFRERATAAAGWTRRFSSDPPPDNISRYPIPYMKDLPYDIVELMEEVESKVN